MTRQREIRFHEYWCVVDGGTGRDGFNGFVCAKCRRLHEEDVEYGLLAALDRYAGRDAR